MHSRCPIGCGPILANQECEDEIRLSPGCVESDGLHLHQATRVLRKRRSQQGSIVFQCLLSPSGSEGLIRELVLGARQQRRCGPRGPFERLVFPLGTLDVTLTEQDAHQVHPGRHLGRVCLQNRSTCVFCRRVISGSQVRR